MTETPDLLDRQLVCALQVSPRASFRELGRALEVSEQTVARRYRALVRAGWLRVTTVRVVETAGQTSWGLRLTCRPEDTLAIGRALARRDDVSWVSVVAGGSELFAALNSGTSSGRDELVLRQLPRSSAVLDLSAFTYLHYFCGARSSSDAGTKDWVLSPPGLDADQVTLLRATRPAPVPAPATLSTEDECAIDVLVADGRASYAEIAAATGWSESTAARRVATLVGSRVVNLDVDVLPGPFGATTYALVLVSVHPRHVPAAGEAIGDLRNVAFAAAVTGPAALLVTVMTHDSEELYRVVSSGIGAVEGVTGVEILPATTTLKQAGSVVQGGRLVPTGAAPQPPPRLGG